MEVNDNLYNNTINAACYVFLAIAFITIAVNYNAYLNRRVKNQTFLQFLFGFDKKRRRR